MNRSRICAGRARFARSQRRDRFRAPISDGPVRSSAACTKRSIQRYPAPSRCARSPRRARPRRNRSPARWRSADRVYLVTACPHHEGEVRRRDHRDRREAAEVHQQRAVAFDPITRRCGCASATPSAIETPAPCCPACRSSAAGVRRRTVEVGVADPRDDGLVAQDAGEAAHQLDAAQRPVMRRTPCRGQERREHQHDGRLRRGLGGSSGDDERGDPRDARSSDGGDPQRRRPAPRPAGPHLTDVDFAERAAFGDEQDAGI